MSGAGYMSNRGRQNVASYLALDLGIDWRLGADWFESVLTDYGACSWAACVLCMCRSRRVTCAGRIACTYSQRCASAFPVTRRVQQLGQLVRGRRHDRRAREQVQHHQAVQGVLPGQVLCC